ncbi:hypothetical protein D3C78_891750 [compost metagenome]
MKLHRAQPLPGIVQGCKEQQLIPFGNVCRQPLSRKLQSILHIGTGLKRQRGAGK